MEIKRAHPLITFSDFSPQCPAFGHPVSEAGVSVQTLLCQPKPAGGARQGETAVCLRSNCTWVPKWLMGLLPDGLSTVNVLIIQSLIQRVRAVRYNLCSLYFQLVLTLKSLKILPFLLVAVQSISLPRRRSSFQSGCRTPPAAAAQ